MSAATINDRSVDGVAAACNGRPGRLRALHAEGDRSPAATGAPPRRLALAWLRDG
jgi:hypothetical protein